MAEVLAKKRAADAALLKSIEDDEMRNLDYVARFLDATSKGLRITEFDAERVADLLDDNQMFLLQTVLDSLTRFTDAVKRRRSGLRLVKGGVGS